MEVVRAKVDAVSSAGAAGLSIGDLAERTGVSAATLRVWESRHGFPVPHRLDSGHRRYDESHVSAVLDVVRRREQGVRLDVAIDAVRAAAESAQAPGAPSVYARLRQGYPALAPQRLTKRTLLALSWAIEDEFASRAQHAHLFGAFQEPRHFASARTRWSDLARTMATTHVFAAFTPDDLAALPASVVGVPLRRDHPMVREWAVVSDSDDLPVALSAWELPGQEGVAEGRRMFEAVWTVERAAVRDAARACAWVAADLGATGGPEVALELLGHEGGGDVDLAQVTSLFNRVVAYVDESAARR